ncbi:four-carbon acid sugar kinase family protein [Cryobacterium adonitolivorans]|nr:four-carbon acid sugar kinase family protein [Cryobacterium adonitolivorans]
MKPGLEFALGTAPPSQLVDQTVLLQAAEAGPTVVVLDDDPTGTQTVTALPILTRWEADDLRWAFEQGGTGFCILTNTRSLSVVDARARNASVLEAVHAAAAGRLYVIISRGDSTLRGHHVDEIDEACRTLARVGWGSVDAVLVVPAFPDAQRVTIDSIHWIFENGAWLPAGDSSFAGDATFGYSSSDLREFIAERSYGTLRADEVDRITLDEVRGDPFELVDAIASVSGGRHLVIDAADENDLRSIALAAMRAESRGRRLLYRTSPGLLRPRLAQLPQPPLSTTEVGAAVARAHPATKHGLVVVGSHVPLSSRQLGDLLAHDSSVREIMIDVPTLMRSPNPAAILARIVHYAVTVLADEDVVLSTSRERIDGVDGDDSLRIARVVSGALVTVTREVLRRAQPAFLIGKGGITSSDLATAAVGLRRATILGSLLPGMVSIWQSGDPSLDGVAATPYAVFPGNVGGDEALTQAVAAFRAGANSIGYVSR